MKKALEMTSAGLLGLTLGGSVIAGIAFNAGDTGIGIGLVLSCITVWGIALKLELISKGDLH